MSVYNSQNSYGSVAKFLHWLVAILIIGMLAVGFIMTGMDKTPLKFKVYGLHKAVGITVLAVVALRLMWKAMNTQPLLPAHMRKIEKFLAHAGHLALYVLAIAMPLTGWAMTSAAGMPVSVFGLFVMPDIVSPDNELKKTMQELHGDIAWVLIVVISLHVLAALLHHFYYKDNVLRRMLPRIKGDIHAPNPDNATGC